MLATIRNRHPRVKIRQVTVENEIITVTLVNDTRVRFDPAFPVPVWEYPEEKRNTSPINSRYYNYE